MVSNSYTLGLQTVERTDLFADRGIENARGYALGKAEAQGATHIVWETIPPVHGTTLIAAKAYRCSVTTKQEQTGK